MNDPIDIVVTGVDQSDPEGQKEYSKYKNEELMNGAQKESNQQAFNAARYRDGGIFRFGFRAIEKNCPGIRKIFLVVANEGQIPSWLDRNHPKLRIVYHDEYIPHDLLPTFNIMPIEMYYYRIPDLSNNFITSNDDFFFLRPCSEDMFFRDNKCVQKVVERTTTFYNEHSTGNKILNNNIRFLREHLGDIPTFKYSHLFEPRQKDFERKIMEENYQEIHDSFTVSRFRHPKNFLSGLFIDYMKAKGPHVIDDPFKESRPVELTSSLDINVCRNLQMTCFNDTEKTDDFDDIRARLRKFLLDKFPQKSSFELSDINASEINEFFRMSQMKKSDTDTYTDRQVLNSWLQYGGK